MVRRGFLISVAAAFGAHPIAVARSQALRCSASTANDWLRQAPAGGAYTELDVFQVHPVVNNLPRAVALLDKRSFEQLTPATAIELSGETVKAILITNGRYRPYLVRAVYPTASPTLRVGWNGNAVHVFAAGLGCAPFTKHPVVLLLDRPPTEIFVMASAAL